MKRGYEILLGLFLFTAFCSITWAQDKDRPAAPEPPRTKLEQFFAKDGSVILKTFANVGVVPGSLGGQVRVTAMELTDAATGHKERGITVGVTEAGRLERDSTSYIDADEIDSLLKGIDYISKVGGSKMAFPQFEAIYTTRGSFGVTVFNSQKGTVDAAIESGHVYKVRCFLDLTKLDSFKDLIARAKGMLVAK